MSSRYKPRAQAAAAAASLAGAEASNGLRLITGGAASGGRRRAAGTRKTRCRGRRGLAFPSCATSVTLTCRAQGNARIPTPRTSKSPAIRAGARAYSRLRHTYKSVRSSATNSPPAAISRSARSDLPLPLAPSSKMPAPGGAPNAAPALPSRTQVAWMLTVTATIPPRVTAPRSGRRLRVDSRPRCAPPCLR